MKSLALTLTSLFFTPFLLVSSTPLWPIPKQHSLGKSVLWLAEDVTFSIDTKNATENSKNKTIGSISSAKILDVAVHRTLSYLQTDNFIPWRFHPRNSNFEPAQDGTPIYIKTVKIAQTAADPQNFHKPKAGDTDESYSLTISAKGEASITAKSTYGLLQGLNTFTQLFYQHSNGLVYTPYAPVSIVDAPKFKHRGLNLDIARSFYPSDVIKHVIDALAMNKFNRLHLHATDAQSWPIDIPAMPELSAKGAYSEGLSYSPEVLADLQEYAAYQGIETIIEMDMPGHTASIHFSHPELIAGFNIQPGWADYSAQPGSGQLKLNDKGVEKFLGKLWNDLFPRITPYNAYFHTGGDELKANPYKFQEGLNTNDTKILQPLVQKFVDFNHNLIRKAGMTPIVWEEMLLEWNVTLGKDVLVQAWESVPGALNKTIQKGHKAIASDYNYWYLDCGKGQWIDAIPGSPAAPPFPYTDYCSPLKNWRTIYSYDPLAGIPINSTNLIVGGEVSLWSEQTDPINLDDMLWPRAAAAAEVLWSGAKDAQGKNRSQVEASPRLSEWRERMVRRGIRVGPVQPAWCTQNGTQCTL